MKIKHFAILLTVLLLFGCSQNSQTTDTREVSQPSDTKKATVINEATVSDNKESETVSATEVQDKEQQVDHSDMLPDGDWVETLPPTREPSTQPETDETTSTSEPDSQPEDENKTSPGIELPDDDWD